MWKGCTDVKYRIWAIKVVNWAKLDRLTKCIYLVQVKYRIFLIFRDGLVLWYGIWIAAWVYWYGVSVIGIMVLDNCVSISDIILVDN